MARQALQPLRAGNAVVVSEADDIPNCSTQPPVHGLNLPGFGR